MQAKSRTMALFGILVGVAIGAMVFSAINTALVSIKNDLSASVTDLQWIMNIFGVVICSTLVVSGRVADIYGRKKIFLVGIFLLAVSMLGSGLAPTAHWIIFFQAILGLAAAILIPVSQALISNVFPEDKRSHAIGIWAAVVGLAMAIGPLLSGVIVGLWGWRWMFLINIPLIFLSLGIVAFFTPESRSEENTMEVDWWGAIFLALTISTFVLAVIQGNLWDHAIILTLYCMSIMAFMALLYVESKALKPILREDLLLNKQFLISSLGNFCLIFFVWGSFFLLPIYLQTVHHYTVIQTGLTMLFVNIPLMFFSFAGGYFYQLYGPKPQILVGFIFLLLSAFLQMHFYAETVFGIVALGALAFGMGWGLIWGPTTTVAVSTLTREHAGVASGTFVTIQEIGGTVGLAITVSVARFQSNFVKGYHTGMWVLVSIALLGLIGTLFMNVKK